MEVKGRGMCGKMLNLQWVVGMGNAMGAEVKPPALCGGLKNLKLKT
jgi:hypothetical protein